MYMISKRTFLIFVLFFVLFPVACRDNSVHPGTKIEGLWGAEHIELTAESDQVLIEYDCARGMLNSALIPDSDGQFDILGTYTLGGGPVNLNAPPPDAQLARYQGRVIGNRLELTVTLSDTGNVIGTFVLVRGESGYLYKCL